MDGVFEYGNTHHTQTKQMNVPNAKGIETAPTEPPSYVRPPSHSATGKLRTPPKAARTAKEVQWIARPLERKPPHDG